MASELEVHDERLTPHHSGTGTLPEDQAGAWSPPVVFEEYRVRQCIGRGGMGAVYLGEDLLLERPVAIKFISAPEPNGRLRQQFLIEARAVARVQHPNVVGIYRVGVIDGRPFIVYEFVRGASLATLSLPIPWQRVLTLGLGLVRGLAAAHRCGVLHRDIKPNNVILTDDDQVKLLDFGLAKLTERVALPNLARPENVRKRTARARELLSSSAITRLDLKAPRRSEVPAGEEPVPEKTVDLPAAGGPDVAPASEEEPTVLRRGRIVPLRSAVAPPPAVRWREGGTRSGGPMIGADEHGVAAADHEPAGQAAAEPAGPSSVRAPEPRLHALVPSDEIRGTPHYMAPELLRGEPASVASDIYSMGVLLFELTAGEPPHLHVAIEKLGAVVNSVDAPDLREVVPGTDARFAAVVARCLRRQPSERYASAQGLLAALEVLLPLGRPGAIPQGNPYRGLLPFDAEHRALFFGRRSDIGTLIDRLRTEPLLLVSGDSGVGKSSLCRAGLLPLVAEGALNDALQWVIVSVVPGRQPFQALVGALAAALEVDEAGLYAELLEEPHGLGRILRRRLGGAMGLLVFIDQAEELVTLGEPAQTTPIGHALGSLGLHSDRVRLLMTARSDFLARLAELPSLSEYLGRALYFLRPLDAEQLREAVVGPARAKGVYFESEALVTTLVESTARTNGGLPLLQFALAELWDARSGDAITARSLASIGGVEGALARHADRVLAMLPQAARSIARRLLTALVTLDGTRVRRSLDELCSGDTEARKVLEALVGGRLLAVRETQGAPTYELAHEALIRDWATLRHWIEGQAEGRVVKERLANAASEWDRFGKAREMLWSARQLAEVERLDPSDITALETRFLTASRRALARRRHRQQIVIAAIPVVLILIYGAAQWFAYRNVRQRIERHYRQAKQQLQEAQSLNVDAQRIRARAFAAFDRQRLEEAEVLWKQAVGSSRDVEHQLVQANQLVEAALADIVHQPLRDLLGDILYERALVAEQSHHMTHVEDLLQRLALYDADGSRRARWNAPGQVRITSSPPAAQVQLERYETDEQQRRSLLDRRALGPTPLDAVALRPGSYLATLMLAGHVIVRYPFVVGRAAQLTLDIPLPPIAQVPEGMVYVPPGRFYFGTSADDNVRATYLATVPLHELKTGAFLIARHETTYAEWISFLRDLPPAARAHRLPRGAVQLRDLGDGRWELEIRPVVRSFTVRSGEMLRYPSRVRRQTQDWLRMPVSGVSRADAMAYAAWLARNGKVPGARLCDEWEWERAARGADDRELPHGDQLGPDDANYDVTYQRGENMGPDEVGAHPASRSPFGLDDMAGNVNEWTLSRLDPEGGPEEGLIRGGGYFFGSMTQRSTNRSPVPLEYTDPAAGFRICSSVSDQ